MKLSKEIKKSAVRLELKAKNKDEALAELVELLCSSSHLREQDRIMTAILEREARQSTGIGMGLAVPHAKTAAVKRLHIACGISRPGIDFASIDGEKARIFFILVSPRDVSGPHIQALAGISRLIKHSSFRDNLLACRTEKEFLETIKEAENKYR